MTSLQDWLDRIVGLRSGPEIVMGLDRVRTVAARLGVAPRCPVILVAGTNGKGSVCAYLDAILRAAGFRVGRYTSPHIHRFNERVAINGVDVTDDALVAAFEAVESARGEVPLTFFEYTTLAAFQCFASAPLDAWVVEVGLGGRLDATNLLDADCAVITSIGIDHTEFLGATRELIAVEKAGVLRRGQPAVIAEPDPPASLMHAVSGHGAHALRIGHDFGWHVVAEAPNQWGFWVRQAGVADGDGIAHRHGLPLPALRGRYQLGNAAAALAALHCLRDRLPVSQGAVKQGLIEVVWPGRFQVLPGRPVTVLDVAHNAHAAIALERALADMAYFPVTHAVFAMLSDKDVPAVIDALKRRIDVWHVAPLPPPRGASAAALAAALLRAGVPERAIHRHASVAEAIAAARKDAAEADRIVVFGSFLTVAQAA
ncbi:MAG: bifunctional tetrahydrofolate synthase/dihydrofolate synthase [Burkholderiales bacterium]|nr:bifunctional tetrahydrofolate synthase/dihydrofolate synthase [Burkholderiales bacterium]